jgi:hypothetical protein
MLRSDSYLLWCTPVDPTDYIPTCSDAPGLTYTETRPTSTEDRGLQHQPITGDFFLKGRFLISNAVTVQTRATSHRAHIKTSESPGPDITAERRRRMPSHHATVRCAAQLQQYAIALPT